MFAAMKGVVAGAALASTMIFTVQATPPALYKKATAIFAESHADNEPHEKARAALKAQSEAAATRLRAAEARRRELAAGGAVVAGSDNASLKALYERLRAMADADLDALEALAKAEREAADKAAAELDAVEVIRAIRASK